MGNKDLPDVSSSGAAAAAIASEREESSSDGGMRGAAAAIASEREESSSNGGMGGAAETISDMMSTEDADIAILRQHIGMLSHEIIRLSDSVDSLIEVDTLLQNEIGGLKNYNKMLWNNVIKNFHPDASITEGMDIADTDKLESLLDKGRTTTKLVRDNLEEMKEKVEKLHSKIN